MANRVVCACVVVMLMGMPQQRLQAQLAACADTTPWAKLLENPMNIILSGQNGLIING